MLCLNNFVIIGFADGTHPNVDLVKDVLRNMNLKPMEIDLHSSKIIVGFREERCVIDNENSNMVLHGVFLDKTLFTIFMKFADGFNAFLENYRDQGVLGFIDKANGVVYAVEDPGATRRLFYYITPKIFIISTDMEFLKSVAKTLNIQLNIDVPALYELVELGYIVSRRTLYKDVNRLFPGEYIVVKIDDGFKYRVDRYWNFLELDTMPSRDALVSLLKLIAQHMAKLCEEIPNSKMVIPVSGGIDSSLLLLLASKVRRCSRIYAFHVNLGNPEELKLSKVVTIKAGVPLYIKSFTGSQLREKYFELINRMLKLIGYPREDDASLPYLISAQLIRSEFGEGTIISLGGEGSDPVFGGSDYYKFFATQLILEKKVAELLKLLKTVARYNFEREKLPFMVLKPILQLILRSYRIRYQYYKFKTCRLLPKRNKELVDIIARYLAQISDVFYNAPPHDYYHRMVSRMFIHKITHVIHSRIKADESQKIITYLPFPTRDVIELVMRIPPEYFFFPIGSRSILRLLLKYFGAPPSIYMQYKSGFSTTARILGDSSILSCISKYVNNCWITKYIRTDKQSVIKLLDLLQKLKLFNICKVTEWWGDKYGGT